MNLTQEDIVNKLLTDRPTSIIRCGDGEGIVLNSLSTVQALDLCNQAVLYRQLGFYPSFNDIKAIRQNLVDAYAGCDVIGTPQHVQKTNSHWGNIMKLLDENVPARTPFTCSIDVAYDMLSDGSYDKLLRNRHVLNYISCRDLDEGFKRKWDIKTVNKYTIGPEHKFTSGYTGEPHYPTQFNKIPRWMQVQSENFPGSLLLVGAGVIGKIYCNWWRDLGGVAMDCGGVFDIWAGLITRGPERGLDKVDPLPTYKL